MADVIRTGDEMTLESNSVNLDASTFELLHEIQRGGSFVVGRLDIVVVVVELYAQCSFLDHLLSRGECHWDVFCY